MSCKYDVAIVGGGPAGLAAALAAKEAKPEAKILIIERDKKLGGILRQCIHNGFGLHYFGEELTGPEYAQRFIDKVVETDIEYWTDTMVLDVSSEREITCVNTELGLQKVQAGAVILAMGCRERTRGALNIPGTRPAGVYTAGCAQRLVNMEGYMPGKEIVILGSGDIGLIMARRMTWEGAKVKLVAEVMPYSGGLNRNIVQCLVDNGIPLKFNHTVTAVLGKERVEGVVISEVDPATRRPIPGTEETITCDTLLLSVGLIPENELSVAAGIEMDRVTNGAVVDETRQTSIPGIFACGNVLHVHDLVDNVSAEATMAGKAAACYAIDGPKASEWYAVKATNGVRYTAPQKVSKGTEGKAELYFRVGNPVKNACVEVHCGDKVLAKRKKAIMTPGEMEKIEIDLSEVNDEIIVTLV